VASVLPTRLPITRVAFALFGALLIAASATSEAATVRASFTVTNVTLDDLSEIVAVAGFSGRVDLDLGPPTSTGTDFLGNLLSVWEPPASVQFSTDSPIQQQLRSKYPLDLSRPTLVAIAVENLAKFNEPTDRRSSVTLREQYFDRAAGLFQFEIIGESLEPDIAGIDAREIRTGEEFFEFMQAVGSLRFNMTGYAITANGGLAPYGNLYGDLQITRISAVPLPASGPLLGLAFTGLCGYVARKSRQSVATSKNSTPVLVSAEAP